MRVYIEGRRCSEEGIRLPLSSASLVYLLQYCRATSCHVFIVQTADRQETWSDSACPGVTIETAAVHGLSYSFVEEDEVSESVRNCCLPVTEDEADGMIRSGLCSVTRHIVKVADHEHPGDSLLDLLGFRGGSLKACAEVSGWTKLCEVDLPVCVASFICNIQTVGEDRTLDIPADLVKVELHLEKPPPLHNDDKPKRRLVKQVQHEAVTNKLKHENDIEAFFSDREKELPHGNMKYRFLQRRIKQEFTCKFGCTPDRIIKWCAKCNIREKEEKRQIQQERNSARLKGEDLTELNQCTNGTADTVSNVEELLKYIEGMTLHDVEYEHLYAEGVAFTATDIIVFVYMYFLLESTAVSSRSLLRRLPYIRKWLEHLVTLPRIQQTSLRCGFEVDNMVRALEGDTAVDPGEVIQFCLPEVALELDQPDSEISRRNRSRQKALKPERALVLQKIKDSGIVPTLGDHPRGSDVGVDWGCVPREAGLKDELPEKRIPRKCQQLENLATAVTAIAKPGDVIVDFCSGGGHLGIIIAYLLPECKVHLVENKEESLTRARSRVGKLGLSNVTLYQCNMDYYLGSFDIGVCLHACGVATDMVLQQCLDRKAAFVICPCCYGNVRDTHLITYPRSQLYIKSSLSYKDFVTLAHAADQTEISIDVSVQGRHCMNLVDTDRASLAREQGYQVTLCSLRPLTCTPKNNLLIGVPS